MNHHPAFELKRRVAIEALQTTIEEYVHKSTGATHYHLDADNSENVFLVALRTVPMDHKGVAHILEHTALCGSERFPVRDPFFMMIRRSLNTFMNAFTSNDWTAYPFASKNRKDFNNLLDVYLDAVFFSRLDELDFLQEGHRLEFNRIDDANSELEYKGVVFNEMKGATSSISSTLWQTLCKHLFANTTYHFNSGGDPQYITDLSYDELIKFYKKHYHPTNAIFMTYGNIPAVEQQTVFEEKALSRFQASEDTITIGKEKRLLAPIHAVESYALDGSNDCTQQSHIVIGWLLGQSTCLKDVLTAQLLSYVLLENSACPLQKYLETTELGAAPSPLCGLEDSYHELVFVCGIAGSEPEHAQQFEKEVMAIIDKIATDGVAIERLKAIVHQIELSHREIGGDGYPYGLQLILTALTSATHRGDPIELMDLDPVLNELTAAIEDPQYIKNLAKTLLVDNQHRVSLVMKPDTQLSQKRQDAEKAQLASIKANLSHQQRQSIIEKSQALAKRQKAIDDVGILPKVDIADIPSQLMIAEGKKTTINDINVHNYSQGTNGLAYQQIVVTLPKLSAYEQQLLPLYSQCLTELGLGDKDFAAVQNLQSETVGSISAFCNLRSDLNNEKQLHSYLIISAKALASNHEAMSDLLHKTLHDVHFSETSRIKDIVSQNKQRKENSITGNGHALAMSAASAKMSPLAAINENWGGMQSVRAIKDLDQSLTAESKLADLAKSLAAVHKKILAMPLQILTVCEDQYQQAMTDNIHQHWQQQASTQELFTVNAINATEKVAWLANTQVNFCAKAYKTVPAGHADAPALTVLGGFLRNGFLHTAIREQGGAYGGGASQDSNIAAFRFYSYRDPRLCETLTDFDQSIDWLLSNKHSQEQLEEAILGVIASLDKPASPAGEAKQAFHNELFGRSAEHRKAFRQKILQVSIDDLIRVSKTYLQKERASIAVISNESAKESLQALGLRIEAL